MVHTRPSFPSDDSASRAPLLRIGCAGWSIPASYAPRFDSEGTHLQRYARVFNAVEINSSFYRPHRATTYQRWAASVPTHFRFSVKMPKAISHEKRLQGCDSDLIEFLDQACCLRDKLGCLLLQLPPSFMFDQAVVAPFMHQLRRLHSGPVACEPRHASWFSASSSRVLRDHGISRVAADPARCTDAALPGGDRSIEYTRLHGSPNVYYDTYSLASLARIREELERFSTETQERWCMFDNTALGHATGNALTMINHV
ncbi:MAG: DUF72 domain-containing protein [Dokdonella sp.]